MPVSWKVAIVRVASSPAAISQAVIDRIGAGWLLDAQCPAEDGAIDLVFRHATSPARA